MKSGYAGGWALAVGLLCLASAARAQEPASTGAGRDTARARPAVVLRPSATPPRRPAWRPVIAGTLLGGAVGGGVGALAGVGGSSDPFARDVAAGVLGAVGYTIGSSIGAWATARVGDAGPPYGKVLVASMASAAVGGWLWSRISASGDFHGTTVTGSTAWCVGAVAGVTLHTLFTASVARAAVPLPSIPPPPPSRDSAAVSPSGGP